LHAASLTNIVSRKPTARTGRKPRGSARNVGMQAATLAATAGMATRPRRAVSPGATMAAG